MYAARCLLAFRRGKPRRKAMVGAALIAEALEKLRLTGME